MKNIDFDTVPQSRGGAAAGRSPQSALIAHDSGIVRPGCQPHMTDGGRCFREVIVGYNGLIESQHPDKKIRGTVGRLEGRQFLKGTENIADLGTKVLDKAKFEYLKKKANIIRMPKPSSGKRGKGN